MKRNQVLELCHNLETQNFHTSAHLFKRHDDEVRALLERAADRLMEYGDESNDCFNDPLATEIKRYLNATE